MTEPLILSGRFTRLEQLSSVYWQARNMAAYSDRTQKVCYLSGESLVRVTTTDITSLERLNEYLYPAAHRKRSLSSANCSMWTIFRRRTFSRHSSACAVLIAAAQKVECEDIAYLCSYDNRQSARRQVQNLRDCCFEICSHVDSLKRSHNEALQRRVLAWLNEQYTRPDLNIAMAAEQFHISKKYVTQFLKDQTGKSFTEYVEELRLSRAMELLRGSELGITEISVQCGFSTQNTFYKAFRRRFGISPGGVPRGQRRLTGSSLLPKRQGVHALPFFVRLFGRRFMSATDKTHRCAGPQNAGTGRLRACIPAQPGRLHTAGAAGPSAASA
ncbi:MAG: helix-turn-helix transcriptional regulator [Ruthenibacterium lactatiformans]